MDSPAGRQAKGLEGEEVRFISPRPSLSPTGIAHLSGLVGALVRVSIEIESEVPSGVPENVVRTVTENSRTLKFYSHGFENE